MFVDQFGVALKARRHALGLSRRRLAELAQLDEEFVRSVERGQNLATLRKLRSLIAALTRAESAHASGTISRTR